MSRQRKAGVFSPLFLYFPYSDTVPFEHQFSLDDIVLRFETLGVLDDRPLCLFVEVNEIRNVAALPLKDLASLVLLCGNKDVFYLQFQIRYVVASLEQKQFTVSVIFFARIKPPTGNSNPFIVKLHRLDTFQAALGL